MDKLTKEKYREYLEKEIEYFRLRRENVLDPKTKAANIRTQFEMMKELYKIDNEKE